MPTEPRQVPVDPSPDAARRRLHIHGIKEMPAGYDAEVAELFRDLRAASNLTEPDLAARLATRVEVVQALEQGALYALPPWPETCRIVNAYGTLLNLDIRPLLRRIYAQIEAGIVELGPKPVPEVPVMTPHGGVEFTFAPDLAAATPPPPPPQAPWPAAHPPSPQPAQAPWPGNGPIPPTQAPWPGTAPSAAPQAPRPGPPPSPPQAPTWPAAPQSPPAQPPQDRRQPPRAPQAQAPQPQQQARPRQAPQQPPQPPRAAPAATPPVPEEKKAKGRPALLKWGIGALIVSVLVFGLWIALGEFPGPSGEKASGPSDQGAVLDPDDPRSRKADKLPTPF